MRRLLVTSLLLGLVNATVAVLVMRSAYRTVEIEFGWFATEPFSDGYVFAPWYAREYVSVALALVVLNLIAVPVAARRGWLSP